MKGNASTQPKNVVKRKFLKRKAKYNPRKSIELSKQKSKILNKKHQR